MTESADVLILAAMPEETEPVLAGRNTTELNVKHGKGWRLAVDGREIVVMTTGIGLVNAAVATTTGITSYSPAAVISVGSAGGLGKNVRIGEIIVGSAYRYADADATAFGYAPGQIPSLPESFPGDPRLVELMASDSADQTVHAGEIVSGNSFVAGDLTPVIQGRFPAALAADMESTAIAQTAWLLGVPFVCVRSISDLCGPSAGSDFSDSIDDVAARAAAAVWRLIGRL